MDASWTFEDMDMNVSNLMRFRTILCKNAVLEVWDNLYTKNTNPNICYLLYFDVGTVNNDCLA